MADLPNPVTRNELYLKAIADGNAENLPEPVTREEIYLDFIAKNGGGGGGGTDNYNSLSNKPQINGHTLTGNKTSSDLGLVAAESGKGLSSNDYTTAEKQVVATIGDKVDKVTGKGLSTEDYTSAEKTKLGGIEAGAEVNAIESISVNGTSVSPDGNKNVAITVLTNAVNDLVNYYLKSETYTQAEVDALISAVSGMHFEAVSSLPTTDVSTNTIYLVPNSSGQAQNIKDEYINLDGTTAGWELIGNTAMDLTNYVQKSSTAGLLKNDGTIDTNTYALASVVTAILDGVSIDSFGDVETALNGKADKSEMSVTDGTGANADKTTIQLKSGTSATVLKTHQDITGKQDTVQYSTMPTAGADYVGKIVQFVGATDTYTNGYFYKCVENSGVYSWEAQKVQGDDSPTPATVGDFIVGTTYRFGNSGNTTVQWNCVEKGADYVILQSLGVTHGTWPAYKMTAPSSGTGNWGSADSTYNGNIQGADIYTYDEKMSTLYNSIKDAEKFTSYGAGLFLVGTDKTGTASEYSSATSGQKIYRDALQIASRDYQIYGASETNTWLGTRTNNGQADVLGGDYRVYTNYASQTKDLVIAPAFNLDPSKVVLNGNKLTLIGQSELPIASDTTLGGIKIGDGLSVAQDGTASVDNLTTAQVNALLALLN